MRILLLSLLFIPFLGNGQFETDEYIHGILIRGKVYAGPTSTENQYGRMWTAGGEIRFFKNHSLGVDWVSFYNSYEHESPSPTTGYYENNGTFTQTDRSYLLIDYRYYLVFPYNYVLPYVNVLTKIGHENEWFNPGLGSNVNIPYDYSTEFNDYGLAIGTHIGFGETRMGLDISLGALRSYRAVKYGSPYVSKSNWKPHMRINLYFNLFKIPFKSRYYK